MPRGLVSSLTCPLQVAMASIDAAIQAFSEASAKVKNRGGVHRGQSAFPNLTWAQSIDKIFTTGRMAIFVI